MEAFNLTNVTSKARAMEEATEEMTYQDDDEENVIKSKRPRTTFALIGVQIGTVLALDMDPKVTVKTVDKKSTVELSNGERMTLSAAADKLMREKGKKWQGVSGFWHFKFNGESLWDIRMKMEKDGLI